jgi:hypothetical protein
MHNWEYLEINSYFIASREIRFLRQQGFPKGSLPRGEGGKTEGFDG